MGIGRPTDQEKQRENWFLIKKDKKISREHLWIRLDEESGSVTIQDLNSSTGTWLKLLKNTNEQIIPEINLKSLKIDSFKFSIGMRCDNLEEMLSSASGMKYLDILTFLGINDIIDIRELNLSDFKKKLIGLNYTQIDIKNIITILKRLRKNFKEDYFNSRIVLKTTGELFPNIEIETSFDGNYIGIAENNLGQEMLVNCGTSSEYFNQYLFRVVYKEGLFYMRTNMDLDFFRQAEPNLEMQILPGHKLCIGSQVFELLQNIPISIGNNKYLLIENSSSISEVINIGVFGIIEKYCYLFNLYRVGEDDHCALYVRNNILDILRKYADLLNLDSSTKFYKTLAEVVYNTFDELDKEYIFKNPINRYKCGAKVNLILIFGKHLFCVNLGDMKCMINRKLDICNISSTHNIVSIFLF